MTARTLPPEPNDSRGSAASASVSSPAHALTGDNAPALEAGRSEHTPGPWHVFASAYAAEKCHAVEVNDADGLTVAFALNFVPDYAAQSDANARLIAAAPDLYRELRNAVALLRAVGVEEISGGTIRAAEAIIAKVEGRS